MMTRLLSYIYQKKWFHWALNVLKKRNGSVGTDADGCPSKRERVIVGYVHFVLQATLVSALRGIEPPREVDADVNHGDGKFDIYKCEQNSLFA